jgi:hypothetical protein
MIPSARTADETDGTGSAERAGRWLDAALAGRPAPPLLIVIGLGDGELLKVLDRRAPQTRVLALEPDPASAVRLLHSADGRAWIDKGRLTCLVDPDYAGADEAWRLFPAAPDAHKLVVGPEAAERGGPAAVRAARVAKQIIFGAKANADARRRFAPGYLTGTLHNLPEILAGYDVRSLTDFYAGCPAIIAGAGPSLDEVVGALGQTRDRAVLIAADTALRPLLNHGLSPQLVVAVDPQALNARHFHALPDCSRSWLVGEASIDPTVIAPFDRRTFWFRVADHQPWPWYHELGIDAGRIDVWGSVLTAAFQVAVLAGCDPIVLVGADLAFTGGRPYCRGTTYEFDWAYAAANGHSIDRAWHPFLKPDEQIRVADLRGGETSTTGYLQSFRDWLVARAQKSGRRVINATGGGIFFGEGIDQMPLLEALPAATALPSLDAVARVPPSAQVPSVIAARLREVRRGVARKPAPSPIDRWRDFVGDGFNADAVGAALDRSERTLDGRATGRAAEVAPRPWAELSSSDAAQHVLTGLPEAMARFRAALSGASLHTPVDPALEDAPQTRERCLADAFALLGRICSSPVRSGELSSMVAVDQHQLGRAPLGALLAWPPHAGWAVRLFEGLLGAAGTAVLARPAESSFFSRPVSPRERPAGQAGRTAVAATHADQACAALVLEWLLCARQLHASPAEVYRTSHWWRGFADALAHPAAPADAHGHAVLALKSTAADAIALPCPADDAQLARVLTGAIVSDTSRSSDWSEIELARLMVPGGAVSANLRLGRGSAPAMPVAPMPIVIPRVLTDSGAARSVFAYSADGGAVCAGLNQRSSVLIREDGSLEPHSEWPRPINGELPFGNGGAIAWSVGAATWPNGGAGHVMHRSGPDEPVTIESLPFGPSAGVWAHGRMHWTCFPFGIGTWAPGEPATFALADLTLYGVHADATGLVLHPRVRSASGNTLRRLSREAWRLTAGAAREPVALGPFGSVSSQSVRSDWTAIAYPEADLIRIDSASGQSFSMTCYYPFMVAWAGRSLVVCTTDGDILLFERLIDVLEGLR